MTLGPITCALAFIAVLCVLTVFFFHTIEGPYTAVNGPMTALLSARSALVVRLAIGQAGVGVYLFWSGCVLVPISLARLLATATYSPCYSTEGGDILRC